MIKTSLTRFMPDRILRYGNVDLCPLDGDIPLLQFLNTFRYRGTAHAKNYLKTYDDFITWCYEIRLIDQDAYNTLDLEGHCYQHEAAGIVNQVIVTREMLYELVYCMTHDEPVHPITIGDLNAIYDEANKHLCLAITAYGLQEVWNNADEELAFPLWQIIKLAVHFLTSGDVKFIKKCRCGSLYLDKTKNSNRRYCNPLTCGSACRSKQYYQRKRLVSG
jgi:predicted RNA-binding Zn ribbon-like protein